ncbi:MAG: cytochrome c oxidase subunit 3 [Lewinellaceae bacterium]|nr:cytochrome c oxidase subunit 3 [Lewinella sp.]MCB9278858.1 cytochrome c oxidase subunit 3 [Lewinellaceae bacterium]
MASTDTALEKEVHQHGGDWSGGTEPFRISYGKLMMWYFLLSDAFTFAGFLIAYGALRFSSPTWPVPDYVFKTHPFGKTELPLIFVTVMSFLLIISSVTMVRAVQEGHRENRRGVVLWMLLTVLGGVGFLSCQGWEWTNLIGREHMSVTTNPFGTHTEAGVYLDENGKESGETFRAGSSYIMHKAAVVNDEHAEAAEGHGEESHAEAGGHGEESHAEGGEHHTMTVMKSELPMDKPGFYVDERGYIHRKFKTSEGISSGDVQIEAFGPSAFGALFFFITGFHGFHVLSGVVFLLIILINAASGLYVSRKNGYEMVEKIGLYWHFVDLVWVFVFLVFYLL